jgi:predicted DNA-binding protein
VSRTIDICIKIPKNIYEELERRAKVLGTNVQIYVRTLLEKHISRARGGVHEMETREVDLMNRLRYIIKKINENAKNDFRDISISKSCIEDLNHVVKDVLEKLKNSITEICENQSLSECRDYVELENLRLKLAEISDPIVRVRMLISKYENKVLSYLKQLFYMERCTLTELAKIVSGISPDSFRKMMMVLLDIY